MFCSVGCCYSCKPKSFELMDMLRMSVVLAFIYFYLIDFIPSFLMSLSENELIGIPIYSLSSVQPFVCVYLACPVLLVVSR